MLSPEKNEVNINELFEYRKPLTIHGKQGKSREIFMRVVGDAEINKARVKALRASRLLRDALADKTSDEYLAYIPDLNKVDAKRIIEMLVIFDIQDSTQEVVNSIDLPFPEEPNSEATLEEREQFQKEVDEYPEKRKVLIESKLLLKAKDRKDELEKMKKKELIMLYEKSIVNELCQREMSTAYYDYVVFYSLYLDKEYKISLYKNFDDFLNLPTDVKTKLIKEYKELELGIDDLKK